MDKNLGNDYVNLAEEKEKRREFLKKAATLLGAAAVTGIAGDAANATPVPHDVPAQVTARCNLLSAAASSQNMDAAIRRYGEQAGLTPQLTQALRSITADELRALNSIRSKTGSVNAAYEWVTSW